MNSRFSRRRVGLVLVSLVSATLVALPTTFGTAAQAVTPTVSFIAFGDAGTGSAGQLALRDRMVAQADDYRFAVLAGDGAYPVGSSSDYASKFFGVYGALFQGQGQPLPAPTTAMPKPVYATPGNHEYDTPGAAGFHDSFALPANGPAGIPAGKFYTYDVDGVHFVSFDSHFVVGWNMSTSQQEKDAVRQWLEADLAAHTQQVTVLVDHHPAYTAGPHAGESEETAMRSTWFPLFATNGVDLLLSAHEHSYQRNHPQSGLTSFVTGGGGGTPSAVSPQSFTAASASDHHYLHVDVAGCTISTAAVLADGSRFDPWSFTAPTCGTSSPPPPAGFSDGFETGDLTAWSSVVTANAGTATVQGETVRSGSHAVRLSATATSGSRAYLRTTLSSPQAHLVAGGDFQVVAEGAAGSNVPLLRLYSDSGTRLLSLYRQNADSDKLWVQHSGLYYSTTGRVPLGQWVRAEVSMTVAGADSSIEVRLDGSVVYQTAAANLVGAGVLQAQIGNDTSSQSFTLVADDIAVGVPGAPPPPPPPPVSEPPLPPPPGPEPEPEPAPVPEPEPEPEPGVVFADEFESGDLAAWVVRTGGSGAAGVQSATVHSGGHAVRLSSTTSPGSQASVSGSLGTPHQEINAVAAVRIGQEGPARANVPLVRLFDAAGSRVVNVYRQNGTSNRVYVEYAGDTHLTSARLPLSTWAAVEVRARAQGPASSVEVLFDGTSVHSSSNVNIGTGGFSHVQFGNDTKKQQFTLFVDDVRVSNGAAAAPEPAPLPAPELCHPTTTPTPTSEMPGVTVLSDNFEGNLGQWSSLGLSGDGSVAIEPGAARTGGCGALIRVSSSASSRAFLSKDLGGVTEVWAEGWFNVRADGADGSNVPFFRGFGSNGLRLFDVYRTNVAGELWLRLPDGSGAPGAYVYTKLKRTIALNTWHHIRLHVAAASGSVQVWYDGEQVADLSGRPVGPSYGSIQSQAEHYRQQGELAVDDVVIKTVP